MDLDWRFMGRQMGSHGHPMKVHGTGSPLLAAVIVNRAVKHYQSVQQEAPWDLHGWTSGTSSGEDAQSTCDSN